MISKSDRIKLWTRANSMCSFTGCKDKLIIENDTGKSNLGGHEAHIIAKKRNGPRGNESIGESERDKYDNLMNIMIK